MPKDYRIMVDYDGVLFRTYEEILRWHNENCGTRYNQSNLDRCLKPSMEPIWGDDADINGPRFDKGSYNVRTKPIEGAQAGISELALIADLAILSSGYDWVRSRKTKWARSWLPEISEAYYLESGESKAEICLIEGANLIIEDRHDYALECAKAGIQAIVLDRYQWGTGTGPEHPLIHHATTWAEIPALAQKILTAV